MPSFNNFSVNFLPTNPVAPEMATVVKGASRSFLLLLLVVVVVLALVVSVFFSSSAFAADFADDDVRRIRLVRCVPDDDEDNEEEAQKRPCFKAVFLLARRIVGDENDAPLLDIIIIIIIIVVYKSLTRRLRTKSGDVNLQNFHSNARAKITIVEQRGKRKHEDFLVLEKTTTRRTARVFVFFVFFFSRDECF